MKVNRLENVSNLFAQRRLSRRSALQAGAVAAAGAAGAVGATSEMVAGQDATPVEPNIPATPAGVLPGTPVPGTGQDDPGVPGTLFVQSFQASTVTADPAVTGGYRVTLSGGLGQTIAFADRPFRDVMAMPQDQFFRVLPFPDDNPPNAALLTDRGDGQADLAIVELRNPVVDDATGTLTYDLQGLADWRSGLQGGVAEEATDLSEVAGTFGATHLFIDDCGDAGVRCGKQERRQTNVGLYWEVQYFAWTNSMGYCYSWADAMCQPCTPNGGHGYFGTTYEYWTQQCINAFPDYCTSNGGNCRAGDNWNGQTSCDSPTGWCADFNASWQQ